MALGIARKQLDLPDPVTRLCGEALPANSIFAFLHEHREMLFPDGMFATPPPSPPGAPPARHRPRGEPAGTRRQADDHARRRERDDADPELAHVVVDEGQDVSPMQWRMLGRRGRHASWTVVGDPAQTAWTGDAAELARARDAALRGKRHTYSLTTNYRNSVEIFDEAAAVIRRVAPNLRLPTAVRATGVPPEHRKVADLPEAVPAAVAGLLNQVEGTVGVITPVGRRDQVAGWLDPDPRVQVVTSLEAKGMEYDGVVLVEPAEIEAQPAGTSTLYVALSRATQRLVTVTATGCSGSST